MANFEALFIWNFSLSTNPEIGRSELHELSIHFIQVSFRCTIYRYGNISAKMYYYTSWFQYRYISFQTVELNLFFKIVHFCLKIIPRMSVSLYVFFLSTGNLRFQSGERRQQQYTCVINMSNSVENSFMKTLIRNEMFMLDEMFQRNASKFAIFLEFENPCSFCFCFISCYFIFSTNECPALVYVDKNQGIQKSKEAHNEK